MATSQLHGFLRQLRTTLLRREASGVTDAQLLESFIASKDEAAFAALVRRHGPMVWGVCRRVLGHVQDAEDAFQATYLVLVHKAASIMPRAMVGNWLYGVAHRTAMKARTTSTKRRVKERQMVVVPEPEAAAHALWLDLQPLLDRELARLPENYRAAIVLCDLEDKTHKEAARQLGWPVGTLSTRLFRARKLLAKRLIERGLTISAGSLAAALSPNAASASVPSALVAETVNAGSWLAAGHAGAGMISGKVAALTKGVVQSMLLAKLRIALAILVMGFIGLGAGLFSCRTEATESGARTAGRPTVAQKTATADDAKSDMEKLQGTWVAVSLERQGEQVPEQTLKDAKVRLVIADNKITATAVDENVVGKIIRMEAVITLDPTKRPKTVDVTNTRLFVGDQKELRAKDDQGIYELAGDTLTVCYGLERPTDFKTKPNSQHKSYVFQRDSKPQPTQGKKPQPGHIFLTRQHDPNPNLPSVGDNEPHVAMVGPDGKEEVWLTKNLPNEERPSHCGAVAASPDGRLIAYGVTPKDEFGKAIHNDEVFLKSVDNQKPGESLKVRGMSWCWSPDGRSLVVTAMEGTGVSHQIIDRKTKESKSLRLPEVKAPQNAELPVGQLITDWSSDGKWFLTTVMASGQVEAGQAEAEMYLVASDGSEAKRIGKGYYGRFSPNGKRVLCVEVAWKGETPDANLVIVDVKTGERERVSHETNGTIVGGYCWSPDGMKIAYVWRRDRDNENQTWETFLMVMDADGRNSAVVLSEKSSRTDAWYNPFGCPHWR
jgi:RNA polymerase sigma factor (sigma-70 family)